MVAAVSIPGKLERYGAIDELVAQVTEEYDNREYENYWQTSVGVQ